MESIKTTNSFGYLSNFELLVRIFNGQLHSGYKNIACILFLYLGFHLFLSNVYAQGPGLYKDGKKILDFGEMIDSSLQAAPFAPLRMEPARMKLLKEVFGEKIRSQVTPQKEYLRLVLECRDIVQGITSYNATDSAFADGIDRLLDLEEKLAQANEALLQKFSEIEKSLNESGYPEEKIERHIQMVQNHTAAADRLFDLLASLRAAHTSHDRSDVESVIGELEQYFIDNIFKHDPPLLNSQPLPVMMEFKKAPIIQVDEPLPAARTPYPTLSRWVLGPDPADLDSTIDVQFTDEIIALAASLNNSPVEMYNYVRDNFEFEAYLGSRKGSQQTLDHRRGNDYDQASLLIALLRVSGIPARYATDSVLMLIDPATNWLGIDDPVNAASILTTCGMEGVLINLNDEPYAIKCRRVWVEAWLPFINYRGAINDSTGFMWVPMDPTFKQYNYDTGINLPAEIGFDAEAFVFDYISTFHSETPIEMFREMLLDSLAIYHPEATYDDLITTRSVIKETDGILPGTLPYTLMSTVSTFSEIPSDKRYYIRFYLYGGSGMTLDYTTSLPEIAGKQVTISYVGATAADQEMIDTAGGIFNITTPYIVDLLPVLKIDGCEVERGDGGVITLGETHDSKMFFTTPVGDFNEMPEVYNTIVAGNYQGIGIDPEDVIPSFFGPPQTACEENQLGQESHQLALTYLNKVDRGGDDLAGMMHQVVMNDVSEAIVENSVVVNMLGKYPSSIEWVGMTVDADRKIIGPFSVDGVDNDCDYMRLGGADGSIQENKLFEDRFEEEAISAIKILELASDSGIPICKITYSIAAECPGINQPASIISAINSALAQGHHVIIPQRQFKYYEWTGTGYIDIDPNTCAAGYIIAGGHNGGATVQVWYIPWYLWFFNIRCTKAIGPVTVDPPSSNDLYCADNQACWTFHVPNIEYYASLIFFPCFLLTSQPRDFYVRYSIKELADTWGPGEYIFRAGGPGECPQCGGVEKTVTIVQVDIENPHENDVFLKGQETAFKSKIKPEVAGLTYNWSVEEGSCNPASSNEKDFKTTLNSENGIKVKLSINIGGVSCEKKRTVKAVVPQIIGVNFQDLACNLKSHTDESIVSSPSVSEWKRKLGNTEPEINNDAAYAASGMVTCLVKCQASDRLTSPTNVQVKADGNVADLYEQEDKLQDWMNWIDLNNGQSLPGVINQYINNYDYTWYYRVEKLAGAGNWGEWLEMNGNPTHHNISVTRRACGGTHYQWVMMNSSHLASGLSSSSTGKQVVDRIYVNLPGLRATDDQVITEEDWGDEESKKLKYGVLGYNTKEILLNKGGMCGGWKEFFHDLAAAQDASVCKRCYSLLPDGGTPVEIMWWAIVIDEPGLNQTQDGMPKDNFRDVQIGKYPFPLYFSDNSNSDEIEYRTNISRWYFKSPFDGHCVNFLETALKNYLYDASFGPFNESGIITNVYSSVPIGRKAGSENADFKTKYFDGAVPHLWGVIWYSYAVPTELSHAIGADDTEIPVASTADASVPGVISIEEEIISYTGKTASSFTGCTRGAYGTTKDTHGGESEVNLITVNSLGGYWYPYAPSTQLDGDIDEDDTEIRVLSTANAQDAGTVGIESEIISYTGKTATMFTGCARGAHGTTAASHSDGKEVFLIKWTKSDGSRFTPVTSNVDAKQLNLLWGE